MGGLGLLISELSSLRSSYPAGHCCSLFASSVVVHSFLVSFMQGFEVSGLFACGKGCFRV